MLFWAWLGTLKNQIKQGGLLVSTTVLDLIQAAIQRTTCKEFGTPDIRTLPSSPEITSVRIGEEIRVPDPLVRGKPRNVPAIAHMGVIWEQQRITWPEDRSDDTAPPTEITYIPHLALLECERPEVAKNVLRRFPSYQAITYVIFTWRYEYDYGKKRCEIEIYNFDPLDWI